jgi:hypothetical protein
MATLLIFALFAMPASASQYDGTWTLNVTGNSANCGSSWKSAVKVTITNGAVTANGAAEGALAGNKLTMSRVSAAGNKQVYEAEFKSPTQGAGSMSSHGGRPCTADYTLTRN